MDTIWIDRPQRLLPIIVLFFTLQRRFISGLLSGGLKG
jgi:ABC-type maltose transport system permease subunit